jgi:hypothetical protein
MRFRRKHTVFSVHNTLDVVTALNDGTVVAVSNQGYIMEN